MRPQIPPQRSWPVGFATDWVSGFHPDRVLARDGAWLDIRPAAFHHDVQYFLGYIYHPDIKPAHLRKLRPRPNSKRSHAQRRAIDKLFYAHLRQLGVDRWYAWLMYRAVRRLGGRHYWFQHTHWSEA